MLGFFFLFISVVSPPTPQSNFECPKGTTYRKKPIVAKTTADPFIPEFAQSEEYCQRRGEDGTFVKEGPYLVWGPNGEKLIEGQYLYGRKEGKWKRWIPSQILEDTWSKGEFVQSIVVGDPRSYVIDFGACIPHEYGVPAAFGSTSYRLIGKRRGFCELRYSIEIEMGRGPLITCRVPLTKKKITVHNTSMGLDFSAIKPYCRTPKAFTNLSPWFEHRENSGTYIFNRD